MPSPSSSARILAVHPGAEQYGSDRVFAEAVTGMLSTGADVRVLLPQWGPLADSLQALGADVRVSGLLVLRKSLMRPSGWPTLVRRAVGDWRRVRREVADHRADIVYVSTGTLPLWSIRARRRAAVVLHLHEAETAAPRVVRRVLARPARSADVIVANSAFSRDALLRSEPALTSRARVVLNPVRAPAVVRSPRADLGGVLRIGYLGRLSPRKGVDVLLAALPALVAGGIDAHVDLVGSVFAGYEWYERELRDTAERLGVADRVRFRGFRADIGACLAEVDVVVVPSRLDEGFGNVAVEAVLAERPVIVSARAGLREAVAGVGTARAIEPESVPDLVVALRDVVARWSTIVSATEDAARLVAERHSEATFHAALLASLSDAQDVAAPGVAVREARARVTR